MVIVLLAIAFGLVIWEWFFAHDLRDIQIGPFAESGFALVVLAGLIDRDGRIRVDAAALGRVIGYFLAVVGIAVAVYFIWFGASYRD